MLDKITLYHDLSTTALSLDQLSENATKGHPDSVALAYYSRATDVMHFDLLPAAAQIRDSYAKRLTSSARSENDCLVRGHGPGARHDRWPLLAALVLFQSGCRAASAGR